MHPSLLQLKKEAEGLRYTSETDAPFEIFELSGEMPQALFELVGRKDGLIREQTLSELFRNAITVYPGEGKDATARAERFRNLQNGINSLLTEIRVYRIGTTRIDVFIAGKLPGGSWGGLRTFAVET